MKIDTNNCYLRYAGIKIPAKAGLLKKKKKSEMKPWNNFVNLLCQEEEMNFEIDYKDNCSVN